jgi:hypothetical protein
MTVEKALRTVERTAREPVPWPDPPSVPRKFRMNVHRAYRPVDHQVDALEDLEAALAADPRFEHMKEKEIEETVGNFANAAFVRRDGSHAAAFIEEHATEPVDQTCFFPIEGLTVHRQVDLAGATLLPPEAVNLPDFIVQIGPTMGSVIGVACSGTSGRAMMRRARESAEHALRMLRAGLREDMGILDEQLRFRLGTAYWFTDSGGGWGTRPGEPIDLELWEEAVELVMAAPISTLPAKGGTGVQQSANRALEWFERAQLATDPLVELLYLFFALEAILGDTSEGLKAERLALRRAVLSHTQGSGFTHPGRTYWLYDEVRSAAVHGEDVPEVSEKQVSDFAWDVRRAINEFLEFARAQGYAKRGPVLRALDEDPARVEIKAAFLPVSD